jgi:hypothetical protein
MVVQGVAIYIFTKQLKNNNIFIVANTTDCFYKGNCKAYWLARETMIIKGLPKGEYTIYHYPGIVVISIIKLNKISR